jgi:protein arginine kinase
MRASAMMHLPALVIAGQMEKVVRAVNQLGMVVRGLLARVRTPAGSIFQISNQTTLGRVRGGDHQAPAERAAVHHRA